MATATEIERLLAYHSDPATKQTQQQFIRAALQAGVLRADLETGVVWNNGKPTGTVTSRGYLVSTVRVNGERRQVKLHQVVWLSDGRDIPDGLILDHENRIKTDNRLNNLRLATPLLNSHNRRSYHGEGNPAARITQVIADHIRELYRPRARSYRKLASEFSVSPSLVAAIVRGELWA